MYNSYCLLYSSHFAVKLACKNNMNIVSYYLWLRDHGAEVHSGLLLRIPQGCSQDIGRALILSAGVPSN